MKVNTVMWKSLSLQQLTCKSSLDRYNTHSVNIDIKIVRAGIANQLGLPVNKSSS